MLNRISFACVLILLLSGCSREAGPSSAESQVPVRARPNVLLVTIDTLRWDYVSAYGQARAQTPNLDRLAAEGVRMEQAIAQVPLTTPSHASIMTGTYPQIHKMRDMGGFLLDKDVPTLAGILKAGGYETAAFVGSAVLNHHYGLDRGFNTYVDNMKDEHATRKLPGVVAEVRGDVVTERALAWLQNQAGGAAGQARNFFAWVHYYDPHFPYDPPEPFRSQYPKDRYAAEVAFADHQVGQLISWLTRAGLRDRTLIAVMADHGESLGDHGEFTHGVFLYDSTMRVPLIIAGPGVPKGSVVKRQVRSIDVMPTIAEFTGIAAGDKVQGVSLRPAIVDGTSVRSNYCYMETLYPKTHLGWSELRGMRTDEFKLVVAPKPELYRFLDDSAESRNVVHKLPADADRLQKKVWEVAGPPRSLGRLEPQVVDEERRRELDALGYVSSGRRSIAIDMSGPDPKDHVAVLGVLEQVADEMNHDRWGAAAPRLARIMREDPTNPLIYTQLQLCYERMGQFEQMERVCLEAIKNGADSDETYSKLGEIRVRRGDLQQGVEFMERAAKINPANLTNLANLATAFLQLGRGDDAARTLQAILAQNPRHATAHNVFGLLEAQRGRVLQAREHLEKAVEFDPDFAEAYLNLGIVAQKTGDVNRAVACYRDFLKRANPEKHRESIPKVRAALAELGAGR